MKLVNGERGQGATYEAGRNGLSNNTLITIDDADRQLVGIMVRFPYWTSGVSQCPLRAERGWKCGVGGRGNQGPGRKKTYGIPSIRANKPTSQ